MFAAATRYFGLIFALGFVLGAVRVTAVAPALGEIRAVLIEAPLMLAASAWWATRVIRRHGIGRVDTALAVGGIAFAELMLAELALALMAAGKTPAQWLADMTYGAGLIGLVAQMAFGLIPAAVMLRRAYRRCS